jgi:hypothetical protein
MAKVIKTNKFVRTATKRDQATGRFVVESSAIEGVKITKRDLKSPAPATGQSPKIAPRRQQTKSPKA